MSTTVSQIERPWQYELAAAAPRQLLGMSERPAMELPKRASELGAEAAMSANLRAIAERSDKQAFEAVFVHFAPRIKAYLMQRGGNAVTAEELTQETMVLVWRKAAYYDPAKGNPASWIFTIARNQRIDAFRREKHPEIDPEDAALRINELPTADTALEIKQISATVNQALADLSAPERQLLSLAFYEDKSHSMIAAELAIPLGTVKSRMRQVFRKLRSKLALEPGGKP